MIDHKELMKQGSELIAANLAECCREELEWQNTALLCNGKMREAGAIYAQVDAAHALSIVQSEVARQAMQVIAAAPQVVADERAAQRARVHAKVLAMPENDAGNLIGPPMKCELPPDGWYCARMPGHEGPCAAPAAQGDAEPDMFLRGVIAALGALAPHSQHGDVLHDEIVQSVGKDDLYRAAEPEDVQWAGLDPEFYAAIAAKAAS